MVNMQLSLLALVADAMSLDVIFTYIIYFLEIKETPGPGTYKIPSAFDKFKRLPAK
jgi:hypothetical protein